MSDRIAGAFDASVRGGNVGNSDRTEFPCLSHQFERTLISIVVENEMLVFLRKFRDDAGVEGIIVLSVFLNAVTGDLIA